MKCFKAMKLKEFSSNTKQEISEQNRWVNDSSYQNLGNIYSSTEENEFHPPPPNKKKKGLRALLHKIQHDLLDMLDILKKRKGDLFFPGTSWHFWWHPSCSYDNLNIIHNRPISIHLLWTPSCNRPKPANRLHFGAPQLEEWAASGTTWGFWTPWKSYHHDWSTYPPLTSPAQK